MSKIRVLFVSGDLCDGGAQRVISVLSNKLAECSNYEVFLYVFSKSNLDYSISDRVHLTYMCQDEIEYRATSHLKRLTNLRFYIKKNKPNVGVGFLQGGYALYFASIGIKFYKIASARVNPEKINQAKGINAIISRYWFRHANSIVLQTESQKDIADKLGWKNCLVIGNPISDVATSAKVSDYRKTCKNFVMVGRLVVQKNYLLVIRAIAKLVDEGIDVCVDIFGTGEHRKAIEEAIQEYHVEANVVLKGWITNPVEEIINYDGFILSSNFEGMPNSLMEAMAVGLPVIATNCNTGPGDLIENGKDGFLISVDNESELCTAIKRLMSMNESERERIGFNARQKLMRSYSSDAIVLKWKELFEKVTGN